MIRSYLKYLPVISFAVLFLFSACKATQKTGTPVIGREPVKSAKGVDSVNVERTFIDGCKYLALDDYDNAIKYFNEVLKMDPNNDASLYQLATIYFKYSKYTEALEYAKNAARIKPGNIEYQLLYGDILNYGNTWSKAAEVYENVLKQTPENQDVYFRLAYSYEKAGDINKSISTLKRLEKLTGPDEQLLIELQRLYNINQEPEKAIEIMQQLLEADPANPTYLRFLSEYYEQAGNPEMAEKTFDILLKTDSNNTDLQFRKASLLHKAGDKQGYYATMRTAFGNAGGNIDTKIFYLVLFVDSLGKPEFKSQDSVLAWTQLLVHAHPGDAKSHAMRGDFLFYSNQLQEARSSYRESLALRSDIYDVWIKLFYINSDLRDYDSLKNVTNTAIEYFPNQPLGYYFNGVALNNLKDYAGAAQVLKHGLPVAGSNGKLRADMYSELGDVYNSMKNYAESDQAFESSLQLNPDNPFTLNNYAYYLSVRNEKLDKAAGLAQKAISLVPDNSSLEDTYAWILYKQKKYADAKKWLEKALQHGGEKSGTVNEHYGDVLYQLGDTTQAVEYWIKAKSLGETSEWIDKKISDKKLYE